jgi:hypothetical protein
VMNKCWIISLYPMYCVTMTLQQLLNVRITLTTEHLTTNNREKTNSKSQWCNRKD